MSHRLISPTDRTERRLLTFASAFIVVYAVILTLSEAARLRTWLVDYHWQHWIGVAIWFGFSWIVHLYLARRLPGRDPFIFPTAVLLTGWGAEVNAQSVHQGHVDHVIEKPVDLNDLFEVVQEVAMKKRD